MDYLKELQKLGLKENEARVYLASLRLGPTVISALSKETGLKRTNIYALVNNLMEKGLFTLREAGFKQYYSAESPKNLKNLVEQQADLLINLLESKIEKNRNSGTNEFFHFKGIGGMKNAFTSMLGDLKKGDFYCVISDGNRWFDTDKKFFEKFMQKRARLNLDLRLILVDNEFGQHSLKYQKNYNEQVKLLPKGTTIDANLVFTPYRMLTHQLSEPRLTTIIESPETSFAQKQIFDIAWESLK